MGDGLRDHDTSKFDRISNADFQGASGKLASDKDMTTDKQASPAKVQSKDRDMGSALRSAYQQTVDESVPDEMMDLLNKLA